MWDYVSTEGVLRSNTSFMHAKHLYIPHLARPLSAKAYGVSQCLVFALERIAQTDCSEGLLKMIAWWAFVGAQVGVSIWFLKWGSHMPRTRVSCWDQDFGCWEFSDMAWVIKKWRRGRACRGAARAASVGKCRSRCVRCMCGRAACAVCRRPAWRRGRRARAAHKYRLPALKMGERVGKLGARTMVRTMGEWARGRLLSVARASLGQACQGQGDP